MIFVYAIYCLKEKRIYVGLTENIEVILKQHNTSKTKSTKAYIPWKLFYQECCENRTEARNREVYLKNASGKRN